MKWPTKIMKKFRRYVDRYCKNRGITTAEALKHKLVTEVRQSYEEDRSGE